MAVEKAWTSSAAPAFLTLDTNVIERGLREQWELHITWYYQHFSLLATRDEGFNTYDTSAPTGRVHVPSEGYHIQDGNFLTR